MDSEIKDTGCCPIIDPSKWDKQTIKWENQKFIKGNVFTIFYMPINFGSVTTKLHESMKKAGGFCVDDISLSYHNSPWSMDIMLAVDRKIEGQENISLTGDF